jgi:hypothetical protein
MHPSKKHKHKPWMHSHSSISRNHDTGKKDKDIPSRSTKQTSDIGDTQAAIAIIGSISAFITPWSGVFNIIDLPWITILLAMAISLLALVLLKNRLRNEPHWPSWSRLLYPIGIPTIILATLAALILWYYQHKKTNLPRTMEDPTFSEVSTNIIFQLGENGNCFYRPVSAMVTGFNPLYVVNPNGQPIIPCRLYRDGGKLYVDIKTETRPGNVPTFPYFELKHNVLLGKPPNWDMNKSTNALEVVDEKLKEDNGVASIYLIY